MIVELAPAKINLALHVRHRRADGYHALETLFAFLTDGDTVSVAPAAQARFTVTGPFADGLSGEGDNLVTRAAALVTAHYALPAALEIVLDKRLPIASGIGGGSADAAATIRALARLHGIAADQPALFKIAEELGADVPACLLGRSAFGSGKGEQLAAVEGLGGTPVLLVNPGVAISTGAVFAAWDGIDRGPLPDGALIERALAGRNDLEAPARAMAPVIGEVVAMLAGQTGVMLARMSGSGATCFALFERLADRAAAAATIRHARPGWWLLESTLA
ncbi:MAG: 4-(cytidine 5'-diphospho)-2-C-methyl-D-erythritol kinase [Sphingomonas sp. 28-66-16]|nr:MAG: 4-(cytidine 5'-diphospho)-2-C-methyl-D-erythritol kinase [Sphingomonas sp. 28-66-16]